MQNREVELHMPDLGLGPTPATVSLWLRGVGATVQQGERLLEVAAGEVVVDLAAPAAGALVARLVEEDDPVVAGQLLAVIDVNARLADC